MVSASDIAADADSYYADFPAAQSASQPDASQYPAATTFPTAAGQFPAATTGQFPAQDPFPDASSQYPETTTAAFPPQDETR